MNEWSSMNLQCKLFTPYNNARSKFCGQTWHSVWWTDWPTESIVYTLVLLTCVLTHIVLWVKIWISSWRRPLFFKNMNSGLNWKKRYKRHYYRYREYIIWNILYTAFLIFIVFAILFINTRSVGKSPKLAKVVRLSTQDCNDVTVYG